MLFQWADWLLSKMLEWVVNWTGYPFHYCDYESNCGAKKGRVELCQIFHLNIFLDICQPFDVVHFVLFFAFEHLLKELLKMQQ